MSVLAFPIQPNERRETRPASKEDRVSSAPRQEGPFTIVPDTVRRLKNPYATQVYITLLYRANVDMVCWPSHQEIADEAGMSERKVREMIALLESHGLIYVESRSAGGMKSSNRYTLVAHRFKAKTPDTSDRHVVPNDRQDTPNDRHTVPVDRHDVPRNLETRDLETTKKNPPTPQRRTVAGPVNYTDDFMRLWNASLRKDKKLQAFRVWEEINPDKTLADQIVRAMETQVRANPRWREEGGRFCPMVDNWLINRRWEDTIDTTNPAEENPKLKGGMGLNLVRERKRLVIARAGCKLESELPRYDARISDVDTDLLALGVTVQEAEAWALRH